MVDFSTDSLNKSNVKQNSVKTFNINNNNKEDYIKTKDIGQKSDNNNKKAVQQFMIEQIKNGWPYDDRYYHTESKQ